MTTLVAMLQRAIGEHGDRTALSDAGGAITYRALGERVARIAAALRLREIGRGDRVALLASRGVASSAAFHGVIAAGAVCVPLAAGGPVERARAVIAGAGASLVLHDASLARHAAALGASCMSIERAIESSPSDPAVAIGPDDLAYVLFTSGSTGIPKGVTYDHGAASLFPTWSIARFELGPDDRVGAVAPLPFDLSTFDLFAALGAGASVDVPPHEAMLFPGTLARWIVERRITVLYAVPSLWTALVEKGGLRPGELEHLRAILFAGEAFPGAPLAALAELAPHAVLENLYGPTETNVCTSYRLPRAPRADDPPLPIGAPLPFFTAALRDPDLEGVGELVIEGAGVMRGYWGGELAAPGAPRRYATGDHASWRADGTLAFHGRRDRMVKVRGVRVELGEVEHALARCEGVREAAVIAIGEGTDRALRAFYVADPDPGVRALRTHLSRLLPAAMIPAELVRLDALPRTATGKVALAELAR